MERKVNFMSLADAIHSVIGGQQAFMLVEITADTTVGELAQADGFMRPMTAEEETEQKLAETKAEPKRKAEAKPKKPKPEIDHGKIMALHKAGWSSNKIAGEMGISAQTVLNHIARDEKAKQEGGNEQ